MGQTPRSARVPPDPPVASFMRIGITCYPTYGGSGIVATELGLELATRGHEIEVCPPWSEGHVLGVSINTKTGVLSGGADPRGQAAPVMPAQVIGW